MATRVEQPRIEVLEALGLTSKGERRMSEAAFA
jgi:hypothetical protein